MTDISVLIVEDQEQKSAEIREVLLSSGLNLTNLTFVTNGRDARICLSGRRYDLLVLDIVIPERAGDAPSQAGIKLLRELLERSDLYQLPDNVVGLTQHQDLPEEAREEFSALYWTLDYYSSGDISWKSRLSARIDYLVRQEGQRKERGFANDVLILTALDSELKALLALPCNWSGPEAVDSIVIAYRGVIVCGERRIGLIAACSPRVGMVSCSLLSLKMILQFRPRLLAMVGIAAGLRSECKIGDVLLADPCWDWQSGRHNEGEFLCAPDQISVPLEVRQRFIRLGDDQMFLAALHAEYQGKKPDHLVKLKVGPVASGSAVVADIERMQDIKRQNRKLIGLEMELYGLYSAGRDVDAPRPLTFGMKSVCDFGEKDKGDDFQAFCCYASAKVLLELLSRFGSELLDSAR